VKGLLLVAFCTLIASAGIAQEFTFDQPGQLAAGSGTGVADATIYFPNMRFPLEKAPAYANSQVYGIGGQHEPQNTQSNAAPRQCDSRNYSYPWHDNFCETRGRDSALCVGGKGHQGQDIRPSTCARDLWWAVAAENGQIVDIGAYSVTLMTKTGILYRYLHLDPERIAVSVGEKVERGQRIGLVSDYFVDKGKVTPTHIHLHFDVRVPVKGKGKPKTTFMPPYASLVAAYQKLLAGHA
jgi:murein DD-endopeptidase MepM/ murein hydrolase activator NlpD